MMIFAQAALVILAGVYAIRSTDILFNPRPFEPLMVVAALAFVLSVVMFYRLPTAPGIWLYTSVALCMVGVIANSFLFFAPDESHSDMANLIFSALSIAGWGIVGLSFIMLLFRTR